MESAYLDSSVLIRLILDERNAFEEIRGYPTIYSSFLLRTECLRVLHRLLVERKISEASYSSACDDLFEALRTVNMVEVSRTVLRRAEEPLPFALGTLDALHLATARLLIENQIQVVILTHDSALARTAAALGLAVAG